MNVNLVRIDDRFIHGQVAVAWTKFLSTDFIIVANDQIAGDELQRTLMEMAKPPNIEVDILTIDEAIIKLSNGILNTKNIILLIDSPKDVLRLIDGGIAIKKVNIGGMRYKEGKEQLTRTVSIDVEQKELFKTLSKKGVSLELQAIPIDAKIDFMNFIN